MKKRMIALLVLTVMVVSLFTACGSEQAITAEKAQEIALEDAGFDAKDVTDIHTHVTTYENVPCYNIHVTVDGTEYSYNIAANGEILSAPDMQ